MIFSELEKHEMSVFMSPKTHESEIEIPNFQVINYEPMSRLFHFLKINHIQAEDETDSRASRLNFMLHVLREIPYKKKSEEMKTEENRSEKRDVSISIQNFPITHKVVQSAEWAVNHEKHT